MHCTCPEPVQRELAHERCVEVAAPPMGDFQPPEPVRRIFYAPQVQPVLLVPSTARRRPVHPVAVVLAVAVAQSLGRFFRAQMVEDRGNYAPPRLACAALAGGAAIPAHPARPGCWQAVSRARSCPEFWPGAP